MNQTTKFSDTYKSKMKSKIKELTKYLELRTGYNIRISVMLDKKIGYVYALQLSLDNFETYSKWIVTSTSKDAIKREILQAVSHFDFKHKKRGGTTKGTTKRVGSTSLKIECVNCGEEVNTYAIHRNINSPIFKNHNMYCYLCFSCANGRAAEIARDKDIRTAILFLCGIYDEPYIISLADEIAGMDLTIVEKFGLYFRRLNLHPSVRGKGATFTNSDFMFK